MQAMMTSLYNLINTWLPLVWILCFLAVVAGGVGCMVPSEETRAKQKSFPWILGGAAVIAFATPIAREIASAFAF